MNAQVRYLSHSPVRQGQPAGLRSADGVALLITVLILFVVSLLGATAVNLGRVDYALSANYRSNTAAVHLADSGMQATAADLRADYNNDPANSALSGWVNLGARPPLVANPFPNPVGTAVNGYVLRRVRISPNPYPGVPYSLGTPVALGTGTYTRTIWLPPTVSVSGGAATLNFRVRSEGTEPHPETPATTIIDGVVRVDVTDVSGYATAMFLGPGDKGRVVSGGIMRVAGPMVVIGEPARGRGRKKRVTELELGDLSEILNGYNGIAAADALGALAGKVPPLALQQYNGDTVAALNTALHLKDVDLVVPPTASLGRQDVSGNRYKETLDGVYTDGTVDPTPPNINVDHVAPFDLGNIAFPSLSTPYTDPASGAHYASYAAWLNTQAYSPLGRKDLEITSSTASFSYVDPTGHGSLSWNAASETLTISGVIRIDGDIILGEHGNNGRGRGNRPLSAVKYAGTGALWATGDIEIKQDLHPFGYYLQDGPDADKRIDGNLGLITENRIELDGGSPTANLRVFAALFAEEQIDVRSSANVAGSVITNHIDMQSFRRLSVWYVPALAAVAPPGMPGTLGTPAISVGVGDWFQRR